jgi:hypothetical protein
VKRLDPKKTASRITKLVFDPVHDPKRDAWYKALLLRAGLPE